MMKFKIFFIGIICSFCFTHPVFAQEVTEVEAKGIGIKRDDALQNALRMAIEQAVGVSLKSETKVENFVVIKDAIATNTEGYIASYTIVKEVPFPDRYEVNVKAKVSLSPLKADFNLLAKSIGGVRFLVMFDDRDMAKEDIDKLNFASERVNAFLAERKYRYIEKNRFESLKKEAARIMQESDTSQMSYVQRLGIMADAQFIIFLTKIHVETRSEAFDTRTASRVVIEAKAYDNCTAEGLGTVLLESDWKTAMTLESAMKSGLEEAVKKDFDQLLFTFTSYIGDWVNNGTPYELRFYTSGTFRDFRDLREKIKTDPNFGGQMEITSVNNYTKLNSTFKMKPDELADKILDYADQVPNFKDKRLDVKFIYGRQISFAPQNVAVPELQIIQKQQEKAIVTNPVKNSEIKTEPNKGTSATQKTVIPVKGKTTTKKTTTKTK